MSDLSLKITNKVFIEQPLEIDTEYQFTGEISIEGANKRSNQEGGFDYTFLAKFTHGISLIKGDKIVKGKDKTRKSQKLRACIYIEGQNKGVGDDEKYYEKIMNGLIAHTSEVIKFIDSLQAI